MSYRYIDTIVKKISILIFANIAIPSSANCYQDDIIYLHFFGHFLVVHFCPFSSFQLLFLEFFCNASSISRVNFLPAIKEQKFYKNYRLKSKSSINVTKSGANIKRAIFQHHLTRIGT